MMTGNKGEWSEVYTLLKILSDRQLYAGDGNLDKIENKVFPIIKVLRDESHGTFEFSYEDELVIINNGYERRIPILMFKEQARILFTILKEQKGRSFAVPEIQEFLLSFGSSTLKARSSVKSDIRVVIHDLRTGAEPELGFSIKSQLGGSSTLLNAGQTTNFVYKVTNLASEQQVSEINMIQLGNKIQKRLKAIASAGSTLEFCKMESEIFEGNLTLIDSALPQIISKMILLFFTSNSSSVSDLCAKIAAQNPMKYNLENKHPFYEYKIKRLLTDIALGMTPSKVWDGHLDATGGYLIVKENGDVICYHIYNRNEFENYLFTNTKFETASSKRHNFGTVYKIGDQFYFNLNLQIRFIK